ncbi:DNA polymerase III subunit delta [Enemella dayhoffiae]|uniref:DNA-directed DNA polymerase n=1 Tax=Enemella dayhoffiae TaxID=2016507 RepID=A0A255GZW5_9ACTN|nr:DNA polymerase III subunit delta [Enemella dayhoffiae]OYO21012.1 DNA polymerase III subunit delta [Enemella dayhoffiae]
MAKTSAFGRVLLVSGPESLLADRAVAERVAAARKEQSVAEAHDVEASRVDAGSLAELSGGSLFADATILVIRDLANLDPDLHPAVLALATDPLPDLATVLVHGGGNKGKGLLDKLKKTKVEVFDCAALKPRELLPFVTNEVRRSGARMSTDAAQFLIDAVGHDLRSLAAAVDQLAADNDGNEIGIDLVRRYFGGRAEVSSFAVADEALAGRATRALEQLRWALSTGVAPVLVTSALASGLRGLGKLQGNRTGMGDNDLARDIGVPPWKLRTMRQQLRGWDQGSLATAIRAVAQADADIKGAADQPEYALERCVLAIATAHRG